MRFFFARPLLFRPRLSGLLLLGMVTGSCHSAKVAYQFQPASFSLTAPTKPTAALLPAQRASPQPGGRSAAPASEAAPVWPHQPHRAPRRQPVVAELVASQPLPRLRMAARPATQSVRRQPAGPRGPAEVGLGTTVLGVLSLIVLPIALIGLALSGGGLVWAVLAGAAALGILVAWLDPFW